MKIIRGRSPSGCRPPETRPQWPRSQGGYTSKYASRGLIIAVQSRQMDAVHRCREAIHDLRAALEDFEKPDEGSLGQHYRDAAAGGGDEEDYDLAGSAAVLMRSLASFGFTPHSVNYESVRPQEFFNSSSISPGRTMTTISAGMKL